MTPKFYTKTGRLTRYALACGYQELHEIEGMTLRMWTEGGPVIHVRCHEHRGSVGGRMFWDSFESLTKARKMFDAVQRNMDRVIQGRVET